MNREEDTACQSHPQPVANSVLSSGSVRLDFAAPKLHLDSAEVQLQKLSSKENVRKL